MDGNNETPDLQSILATLAQFASPAQAIEPADNGVRVATPTISGTAPLENYQPTSPLQPTVDKAEDPRLRPHSRSATASPQPIVDPATITKWQDGLRCVTSIAAKSSRFADSIRRVSLNRVVLAHGLEPIDTVCR